MLREQRHRTLPTTLHAEQLGACWDDLSGRSHRRILADLPVEARLVFELEALKDLERRNPLTQNPRRERVAEHAWHTALAVVLLAGFSSEPIDVAKAALLAVIHETAEAFVGDTFAFGPDVAGKDARERRAMQELRFRSCGSQAIHRLVDLWEEYEAQETPEARFVKGMDVFLPIVLNFTNVKSSSWVEHGVQASQVRQRVDRVKETIGYLAELSNRMIDEAQAEGHLK
jgi:putative hydrolase of HD superfamily